MTDNTPPTGSGPTPGNGRRYWIDADGNVKGVVLTDLVDYFVRVTGTEVEYFPHKPGEPPAGRKPT